MSYKSSLQYKDRVDQLVDDKDPLDILSSTIDVLEELIGELSEAQTHTITAGSWSINDVLQHLTDAEMVNGYRLRMVLTADHPELPGYNQSLWVDRFNSKRSTAESLSLWKVFRAYNLRVLKTLTTVELERSYRHQERGVETARDLVKLMAGHDLIHIEQVKRLIDGS